LSVFTASGKYSPMWLPAGVMDELELMTRAFSDIGGYYHML